jgi:arylsulfatase A-like enzyme
VDSLSRRSFLRTTALGSAGLVLGSKIKAQPAKLPQKPNLIVFLTDQQRADTLACYGARRKIAPNLDKLASQSCVFERAYVTHPLCTPSRSSLLTGTWPHMSGCIRNAAPLPNHFQCLPEMMGDSDYRTAYIGKWHLGEGLSPQHGFEQWVSILHGGPQKMCDYEKFLLSHDLQPDDREHGHFSHQFASTLPLELSKPKFLEGKVCQFLEQQRRDPFLLFMAFWEPHPPYNGPLNDRHVLDQSDLDPTRDDAFGEQMPLRYRLRQKHDRRKFGGVQKHLRTKRNYFGLVTEVDQTIGVVLSKLEQLGLANNTIVVFTSDHGDMMGAHGLYGKQVSFEESVRVPYLVRLPGQNRTVSISQPVSHIDFVPTLLDLLGKPLHQQCVGKSRMPLMRGDSMAPETIFVEWTPNRIRKFTRKTKLATPDEMQRAWTESTRVAISPDGWKICLRDRDKNELYNLQSDPREKQNIYDNTAHKDVVTRLTGEIHRWQERVADVVKV